MSASALACFKSYLSLRKQVVRIGSELSDPLPLTVGVAQGSILGPVLFTLYVNDLLSVRKKCEAMGYVDDTKLLLTLSPSDISVANSDLNSDQIKTNQAPPYLCNLFHDRFRVSGRSTRNMSLLNLPKCRLSTAQRSFAFRGAKEYNLLPENIRNLNNI